MEQILFVGFVGGTLVLCFVYLGRRERSRAAVYWGASWLFLYAAALLTTGQASLVDRALASVCGTSFAVLLLAGALAFSGRRTPGWLFGLGAMAAVVRGAAHFAFGPSAYWLILPIEIPLIAVAAVLVERETRDGSLLERLLAPAFVAVVLIDSVDAVARALERDATPFVLGWVGVMLAVALIQLASLLERALARERSLAAELDRARKLETLGRLAGGVAHDFNNQLTSIIGCAELIEPSLRTDDERAALRDLLQAAHRCAALTADLLAFARRAHMRPRPVPAEPALRRAQEWLRGEVSDKVRVWLHVEADTPPLLADPARLDRTLRILAANARDAVGPSGTIELAARPAPASEGRELPEGASGWVEIRVSDTGIGMDAAAIEQMFDPFYTTKSLAGGAGLGLGIAYGTVAMHGGSIDAESQPGQGTSIRVHWPATAPLETGARGDGGAEAGGHETILLVDDEDAVRQTLRAALESAGFRVVEAADGEETLRRYDDGLRPDAVVVDLSMPRRDGMGVFEELRRRAPALPVLLISGHPARQEARVVPRDVPLLEKPFRPRELAARVRALLDEARS